MSSPVVLYIDDQPEIVESRRTIIESLGYTVVSAPNALAAMQILYAAPVAAVLVEYKREGAAVEDVALHLPKAFPNMPIILVSAYPEVPDSILWLVDDYLLDSQLDLLPESIARAMRPLKKAHTAA